MRAFVTGIVGFAGSHLAELLLANGVDVYGLVLDRQAVANLKACLAGHSASRLHLIQGNLLDQSLLEGVLRAIRPDRVYHLAALSSVRQSLADPAATFRVNVLGTQTLLEAIRSAGLRPRILYVGSAEAYGESAQRGDPVDEDQPLLPVSPYGASKAAAEWVVRRYVEVHGMDIVRVRPFPHTGPRQAPTFVFPDWARQLAEIEAGRRPPQLLVGNLEIRRDISDVRDVVVAYRLCLERGERGAAYNVCSGRVYSLQEVLDRLIGIGGLRVKVVREPGRLRTQDLECLAGRAEALRALAGWAPSRPLDHTLQDLLLFWREEVRASTVSHPSGDG